MSHSVYQPACFASPNQEEDWLALLVLQSLPHTAAGTLQKLFDCCRTPADIRRASIEKLSLILGKEALEEWREFRDKGKDSRAGERACRDLEYIKSKQIHLLTVGSEYYPEQLKYIHSAPPILMVEGSMDALVCEQRLAVVGSRKASPTGQDIARDFSAELAASGFVITSGLALGVDGAAHLGALSVEPDLNQFPTIAVVATGIDLCYPSRHMELKEKICERGAVVSEFPLGTHPKKENFPRRNRIISGLARGVLVVEAEEKSGSLITARYALEQNREVFAVPGSIKNPASRGCHRLIREGAKLVESVDDILSELEHPFGQLAINWPQTLKPMDCVRGSLDEDEAFIVQHMDENPVGVDQLARRTSLSVEQVLALLVQMELKGIVESGEGGLFHRLSRLDAK